MRGSWRARGAPGRVCGAIGANHAARSEQLGRQGGGRGCRPTCPPSEDGTVAHGDVCLEAPRPVKVVNVTGRVMDSDAGTVHRLAGREPRWVLAAPSARPQGVRGGTGGMLFQRDVPLPPNPRTPLPAVRLVRRTRVV